MSRGKTWTVKFSFIGLSLLLGVAFMLLTFLPAFAQETKEAKPQKLWTGKRGNGRVITQADLNQILQTHALWLRSKRQEGQQADLHEADLSGVKLWDPNLSGVRLWNPNLHGRNPSKIRLSKANLSQANLSDANLSGANMSGVNLFHADLSRADLRWASLRMALPFLKNETGIRANLIRAILNSANLSEADIRGADLIEANMCDANLSGANLTDANLSMATLNHAILSEAILNRANLSGAKLLSANLRGAELSGSDLSRANLWDADLSGANLFDALLLLADFRASKGINKDQIRKARVWSLAYYNKKLCDELDLPEDNNQRLEQKDLSNYKLSGFNLQKADLSGFNLTNVNLRKANISYTNLHNAIFEPKPGSLSDVSLLIGIRGLSSIKFNNSPHALVELREAYKKAGMREEERQVTCALNHTRREKLWEQGGLLAKLESLFQLVCFEWTCGYGMNPGQPLQFLGLGLFLFTLPYLLALRSRRRKTGIWLVLPPDRILGQGSKVRPFKLTGRTPFRPLPPGRWPRLKARLRRGLRGVRLAFYFSLLSAFNLGWRELNVGNWISRLQHREYNLRATGWPRTVAGFQSLLSVYLLALWVLTYFGRPFE